MNISVIGLGKLGLCTAACFASKGHKVIGLDKNEYIVNELMDKHCPIDETGLPDLLEKAWDNLSVTFDMEKVVNESDMTLIITPTPSDETGRFNNEYVKTVLKSMAPYLKKKESHHIVDVVSTVMPSSCEKEFIPMLEELTGKKCGIDFGMVYNPEFIALGSVIWNFLNPDMVLIGASDEYSGKMAKRLYEESCENTPKIEVMSLVNAEITKISLNCYVTMKISYANELSSICEKVGGADIDVITSAIGADTRVGKKYIKGGLGFGGPCFPRDNRAFQVFANEFGAEARLGKQVVAINNDVVERLYKIVTSNTEKGDKIALLGLSYKPSTHIIEESQSVMLAKKLSDAGYKVVVHDPKALKSVKEELGDIIEYYENPYECIKGTKGIVLLTDWREYKELNWEEIEVNVDDEILLLDCWRILKDKAMDKFNYVGLGIGIK